MDNDCIFCRIVAGETEADVVFDGDNTLFFRDISPRAKVHVLGIPKQHVKSLSEAGEEDCMLMGELLRDIKTMAHQLELDDGGYRVITNVGPDAGQDVKHLHWHILGGENLGPLRC